MIGINKWIGIGNLGKDPEVKTLKSGDTVSNVTIACSESYKDKATGEKKEHTEWVNIYFWGKLGEVVANYARKGTQVYIEGSLRTKKYTDKDGVEKYSTQIKGEVIKLLGKKNEGPNEVSPMSSERVAYPAKESKQADPAFSDMDDDIPF